MSTCRVNLWDKRPQNGTVVFKSGRMVTLQLTAGCNDCVKCMSLQFAPAVQLQALLAGARIRCDFQCKN